MNRYCAYNRAKYMSSGQALIIVVVIMFLLLGLSGVFVAVIANANLVSVRMNDQARLTDAVRAAYVYATNNLINSSLGADWTPDPGPDPANPGWLRSGNVFFHIDISYGSNDIRDDGYTWFTNENDRFVRIEIAGRYILDNAPDFETDDEEEIAAYERGFRSGKRYIRRHIVAFMPIGLTDNLRWITNRDNSPEPIVMGSTAFLRDMYLRPGAGDFAGVDYIDIPGSDIDAPYYNTFDGPVRVYGNLIPANIHLRLRSGTDNNIFRNDNVIVYGNVINNSHGYMARIFGSAAAFSDGSIFDRNNGRVFDFTKNSLLEPIKAPSIVDDGFERYRILTRDSGEWAPGAYAVNPSYYGRGDGIYINNPEDIQFGGDLTRLHKDFVTVNNTDTGSCWINGNYDPAGKGKAVEITLKNEWVFDSDDETIVLNTPKIELSSNKAIFFDLNTKTLVDRIVIDYPKNGVIFAEGNVVLRGNLPASKNMDISDYLDPLHLGNKIGGGVYLRDSGGDVTNNVRNIEYYHNDLNRRYDLTIVSGGTIYIDNSINSPSTNGDTIPNEDDISEPYYIRSGDPYDSKLALLAADDVVFNPTNIIVYSGDSTDMQTIDGRGWIVDNASLPFEIKYKLAGQNSNIIFWIRAAGDGSSYDPANYAIMHLLVNGLSYVFDDTAATELDKCSYFFGSNQAKENYFNWINPPFWSTIMAPPSTIWQDIVIGGGDFAAFDPAKLLYDGSFNTLRFILGIGSTTGYYVSFDDEVKTAIPSNFSFNVDALIYAERGSWFVIPGPYFNNDESLTTVPDELLLSYREAPDVRITINGAINENRPARPEYETEWNRRWRGTNKSYFGAAGDQDPAEMLDPFDGTSWKRQTSTGIVYNYDAGLSRPVCYDVDGNGALVRYFPRLPRLPVSSTVIAFGMRHVNN